MQGGFEPSAVKYMQGGFEPSAVQYMQGGFELSAVQYMQGGFVRMRERCQLLWGFALLSPVPSLLGTIQLNNAPVSSVLYITVFINSSIFD